MHHAAAAEHGQDTDVPAAAAAASFTRLLAAQAFTMLQFCYAGLRC
jgi:hypothetical protein